MSAVLSFVLGMAAGAALAAVVLFAVARQRVRRSFEAKLARAELEVSELRMDRAEDREINRRLRHELAVNTPETLAATRDERDLLVTDLDRARRELERMSSELSDRDRSLREARLAIQDIRIHLERERFLSLDDGGQETSGNESIDLTGADGPLPEPAPSRLGEQSHDPGLDPASFLDGTVDDVVLDDPAVADPALGETASS